MIHDNTAWLRNVAQETQGKIVLVHLIRAVALSPDGKTALTGNHLMAQMWDVASRKPLGELMPHNEGVNAVVFSPDGKIVLTGSDDNTARFGTWRPASRLGNPWSTKAVLRPWLSALTGKQ